MTDRELLELAAKAAGYRLVWLDECGPNGAQPYFADAAQGDQWNPLESDGDTARLEADLAIDVLWVWDRVFAVSCPQNEPGGFRVHEDFDAHGGDKQRARRHASTRAAAEIGRVMG